MLMKLYWIVLPLLGLTPLAFFSSGTDQDKKEQVLVQTIISSFDKLHFQPRKIDDAFSAEAFDACLSAMDYDKKLLTQENIAALQAYRQTIDDELKSGNLGFFNASVTLLDQGIAKAKGYMLDGLEKINLKTGESFETDPAKRAYAANDEALKALWRKIVKKEVLQNLLALENLQTGAPKKKDLKTLTREAIAQARQAFESQFANLAKQDRYERLSTYINAVLALYGPHNEYLTPAVQEDFNVELTRSLQGIGVSVIQKNGDIQVIEVIPGGPASRSGEIEEDDIVLKVSDATGNWVDIKGFSVNEAVRLFRGDKGTSVQLIIQKPNGTVKVVSLIRDVVILEEGLLKSALLEQPQTGEKVGYLQLPRFYFSRGEGGHRCAEDLQLEIEKLKKQGVKGLIIDLRNNYGGSMAQTLKMMGLFIETGPLVQRQAKGANVQVLSDEDGSVLYDGEVVVLVNYRSASASELFSATLQDYDRAVIVGSKSTYGKGTIQNMFELDDKEEIPDTTLFPLGSLKMTVGQFLRINGASTQLDGVQPDIVLPDHFALVETGEKLVPHALPATRVAPLQFSQQVNTNPNLKTVIARSKQRIETDPQFIRAMENARRWKEAQENTLISLDYEGYKAVQKAREMLTSDPLQAAADKQVLKVGNLPEQQSFIEADAGRVARNKTWLKAVAEDYSIRECFLIVHDLVSVSN